MGQGQGLVRRLARLIATASVACLAGAGHGQAQAPGREALTCETGGRCGGDLVGRWRLLGGCAGLAPSPAFCAAATVDTSGLVLEGTVDFDADGRFTASVEPRGTLAASVPDECLMGLACEAFADAVIASGQGPPVESARCTHQAGTCRCLFQLRAQAQSARGGFVTAGTTVTLDGAATQPASLDYCRTSDRLSIADGSLSVGAVTLLAPLVLERQR
jgi:hypothetical protein